MVTDKNGIEVKRGQSVLVHQDEETRSGTVVKITESKTVNYEGYWIDIDFGNGPEGIPSYIMEVIV